MLVGAEYDVIVFVRLFLSELQYANSREGDMDAGPLEQHATVLGGERKG